MLDNRRRRKILGGQAMSGPVALGAYLILLALILIFNNSAHRR